MLEKNSIHPSDSQDLIKNLRIQIKVEKVPQIERIGGLDHFCPEVALNSSRKILCQGKKLEAIAFGRIRSHDGNASGAGEDDQVISLHGRKGEDLYRTGKGSKISCPDDVRLL